MKSFGPSDAKKPSLTAPRSASTVEHKLTSRDQQATDYYRMHKKLYSLTLHKGRRVTNVSLVTTKPYPPTLFLNSLMVLPLSTTFSPHLAHNGKHFLPHRSAGPTRIGSTHAAAAALLHG
ncbi:hypothetical protein NPIL_327781 [Nephila pilipes]|uniref:Uncharacterized protein n=1 Tax=Nephila pilipes TaxID=299642 RepID=A0A8X6R3P0_NEPPI|nr:hypothetical protein NPIL_327781 [Nephila pilipes]